MNAFIQLVGTATLQTLAMVALSTVYSRAFSFPLGELLAVTDPAGIAPRPALNQA